MTKIKKWVVDFWREQMVEYNRSILKYSKFEILNADYVTKKAMEEWNRMIDTLTPEQLEKMER